MVTTLKLRLKSLEDDEPWIIEQKNFSIVNNFLQPDSQLSVAEAAFRMNELTPIKREARGERDVEEPERYLREIWAFFIVICKQIPHDHPAQDKLVSLIRKLTLLPSEEFTVWKTVRSEIQTILEWIKFTNLSDNADKGPHLDRLDLDAGMLVG